MVYGCWVRRGSHVRKNQGFSSSDVCDPKYGTNQSMGRILDCFCKGIIFTQSHRPEVAIPDSYDKWETDL